MNMLNQSRQHIPGSGEKLEDVIPMLREREQLIQWLTKLEDKKDGFSEKIYLKLKEEYFGKIALFDSKIVQYQPAVELRVNDLRKKHDKLTALVTSMEDEIQEGQLRFAVGELSKEGFAKIEQERGEQIQNYKHQLEIIYKEKRRLEDVTKVIAEASRNQSDNKNYSAIPGAEDHSFQRLSDDGSRDGRGEKRSDDYEFNASLEKADHHGFETKSAAKQDFTVIRGNKNASNLAYGPGMREFDSTDRTLRCQECGMMNFPNEWYCEKCGAELTAK